MSGVYGDVLSFFPELMQMVTTFTATAKSGGGYYKHTDSREIIGVLQHVKKGKFQKDGDVASDVLTPMFWTEESLGRNAYIETDTGDLYRRVQNGSWFREGGMYVYVLEAVTGVSEKQETDPKIDLGLTRYD